ncbi:MAG TPA: NAD(P)/FAD-dependent oxidoreductase [Ilumatobacter sp.]|nr:NAD(P)/FAD-dependent oxidoreductase [Ilumatobacter sp.]
MTSRVAVIGAGPAGLTAAYRLLQQGHRVEVFERAEVVGGRTHSEHHGDGHWVDTGAGWLASFYPRTLALLEELGQRHRLSPMSLRGGGDLLLDGRRHPTPNSIGRILRTDLLGPVDKARFIAYMARLFVDQDGELAIDQSRDDETALAALTPAGRSAVERIVRPNFEGPFFARLEDMSGALVRSWLRVLAVGTFFHVEGGMDAPWRDLGDLLDVRCGVEVRRVERDGSGIRVVTADGESNHDQVVLAVPAPVARELLADDLYPDVLDDVRYVPHVRLYAARRGAGPGRSGVHVFPNDLVATVEFGAGRFGAWGQVPEDWAWGLVCAPAATSAPLLDEPADSVADRMWTLARQIDPRLFPLERADVVQLIRWPHAVPLVDPGYYRRLGRLSQRPPIVFAGDWLVQPCVEGAVRSGEAAADLIGRASP